MLRISTFLTDERTGKKERAAVKVHHHTACSVLLNDADAVMQTLENPSVADRIHLKLA